MQSILLLVPEAESLVDDFRRTGDWSRRLGVPAHITLAGPWPRSLNLPERRLSTVVAAGRGTGYTLDRVGTLGDAVSLLLRDEAPLAALRTGLIAAVGEPDSLDPSWRLHVTVCRDGSDQDLQTVRQSIGPALPLDCEVRQLCIARLTAPECVELTTL